MARQATERIVGGLYWTGRLLLAGGGLVILGAIVWTHSSEDLLTATQVAGWGFLLPAIASFGLASLLDREAVRGTQSDVGSIWTRLAGQPHPYSAPLRDYLVAVAAVVLAGLIRSAATPLLHSSVPFVTFYLAVAVTGWLAGFGPAIAAAVLSALVALYFFMDPVGSFASGSAEALALGLCLLVTVGISAITAALHAALRRLRYLDAQLAQMQSGDARHDTAREDAKKLPERLLD